MHFKGVHINISKIYPPRRGNFVSWSLTSPSKQCAGCLVNHKLVDNLGLVVEYDLRGEIDEDNVDSK